MSTVYLGIAVMIISIPIGVFLRFLDLGMELRDALTITIVFPFEVIKIHYVIYQRLKSRDRAKALKTLFLPITNLPVVIVSIADMHMNAKAKAFAIFELLNELEPEQRKKFIKKLKHEGVIVKIEPVIPKKAEFKDTSALSNYLSKVGFSRTQIRSLGVNKEDDFSFAKVTCC